MDIISSYKKLSSTPIIVPGSKSHTIRALLLACLAEGDSVIKNPLQSKDCFRAAEAIKSFGAKIDFKNADTFEVVPFNHTTDKNIATQKCFAKPGVCDAWIVKGAGKNAHCPNCTINVGNSGSTMYFFAPVAAAFNGKTTFTGDSSICKRPINHLLDLLNQLGAKTFCLNQNSCFPPFAVQGPLQAGSVTTDGRLSQYISGLMMASILIDGPLQIELTDPKEVPYLKMTQEWLSFVGAKVDISSDFKHIKTYGKKQILGFKTTIPADWESVTFPLIAALISKSNIVIDGIDTSNSQGDSAIVGILQSLGANLAIKKTSSTLGTLFVNGNSDQNLSTIGKGFAEDTLRINISGFPDAVCALSALACFVDGTIILEDVGVCRKKETDRIAVLVSELTKLGANVTDGLSLDKNNPLYGDCIIIQGSKEALKGGIVESYGDHRIAMSLACFGLGIKNGTVVVKNAECCNVSFPNFFETMNTLGANFVEV